MQEIISENVEQTQRIGFNFSHQLQSGDILVLYGDLGAGKTTFMQGFAKGLGITKRIISPTFVIIREYCADTIVLYHVDLYRLLDEHDVHGTGLMEILKKKNAIVAIEWPEKLGALLPKKRWEIHFEYISAIQRKIQITYYE